MIDYENEAISDEKKGAAIEYVIPPATILIQNPIAVLSKGNTSEAQKFVNYLLSPAGQTIWVSKGYRPVIPGVPGAEKFPTPTHLFTIDTLGGWKAVTSSSSNRKRASSPRSSSRWGLHCQVATPPWRSSATATTGGDPLSVSAGGSPLPWVRTLGLVRRRRSGWD